MKRFLNKLYWKMRKLIDPEFVKSRNEYIQYNIHYCERLRGQIGEERFNTIYGKDYIEEMKKDLV